MSPSREASPSRFLPKPTFNDSAGKSLGRHSNKSTSRADSVKSVSRGPSKNSKGVAFTEYDLELQPPDLTLRARTGSPVEAAVSLALLQKFSEDVLGFGSIRNMHMTTAQVVKQVIIPRTSELKCRYADHPELVEDSYLGMPTYFVSHMWSQSFAHLVDSISLHLAYADPTTVFLFIDVFSANQHPEADRSNDMRVLDGAVDAASATLIVLDEKAELLSRCWCLYEIWTTLMGKGPQALHFTNPIGVTGLAYMSPGVIRGIKIQAAITTFPEDKVDILRSISGLDGSLTVEEANTRIQMALLLLLPPDFRAHARHLRDRTRLPSKLSHTNTINISLYQDWLLTLEAADIHFRSFAILGGVAAGKSTIAASLMSRDKDIRPQASFFCQEQDRSTMDPILLLRSLAYQLSLQFPVFAMHLIRGLCMLDVMRLTKTEAAFEALLMKPLEAMSSSFSNFGATPQETGPIRGRGLTRSNTSQEQPPHITRGIVLLLDGLCEACIDNGGSNVMTSNPLMDLVQNMMLRLPIYVRLVLTLPTQKEHRILVKILKAVWGPFEAKVSDMQEEQFIMHFIGEKLQPNLKDPSTAGAAVQLIIGQKESTCPLLYLELALMEMTERIVFRRDKDHEGYHVEYIDKLPKGLYGIYGALFRLCFQSLEAGGKPELERLLQVLTTAREPVTIQFLQAMNLHKAIRLLPGWGSLFYMHNSRIHVAHRSVFQFLKSREHSGSMGVDLDAGNAFMCQVIPERGKPVGLQPTQPVKPGQAPPPPLRTGWSPYLLRYAVAHASLSSSYTLLEGIFTDFQYWSRVFKSGQGPDVIEDIALLAPGALALAYDLVRWGRMVSDYLIRYPESSLQLASDSPKSRRLSILAREQVPWPHARMINPRYGWPLYEWQSRKDCRHDGRVTCLDWSVDSSLIASGGRDGMVRVWHTKTGRLLMTLQSWNDHLEPPTIALKVRTPSDGGLSTLSFSSITGAASPGIGHQASTTGLQRIYPAGGARGSSGGALGGASRQASAAGVLAASAFGTASLPGTEKEDADSVDGPPAWVEGVWFVRAAGGAGESASDGLGAFGADVQLLAAMTANRSLVLWDALTGNKVLTMYEIVEQCPVTAMAPDESFIEAVGLLSVSGVTLSRIVPGRPAKVFAVLQQPDYSQYSHLLKTIRDLPEMTRMIPKCLAPSKSEGVCVVGFSDGSVSLWSSDSLKITLQREEMRRAEEEKQALENQDKSAFASSGGDDGSVVTVVGDPYLLPRTGFEPGSEVDKECVDSLPFMAKWDLITGRHVDVLKQKRAEIPPVIMKYSPDGSALVMAHEDHTISMREAGEDDNSPIYLSGHAASITTLQYSTQGDQLASGDALGRVIVWQDAGSGNLTLQHSSAISSLSFNTAIGRNEVACGVEEGSVWLWNCLGTKNQPPILVFEGHTAKVSVLAFSTGGAWLVSGSADETMRVWNTVTGGCEAVLEGHSGAITALAFVGNGTDQLASASRDSTVRTWTCHPRGGWCQVSVLKGLPGPAWNLVLSPDRSMVLGWSQLPASERSAPPPAASTANITALERDRTGPTPQLLNMSALPAGFENKLTGAALSLSNLVKSTAADVATTAGAGDGGGVENAIVWDLFTGKKVAGYSRVISAAWWASATHPPEPHPSHSSEGQTNGCRLVVATPEFVQVRRAPRTQKQSASKRVGYVMQSLSRTSKDAGGSFGVLAAGTAAEDADADAMRGYYCVDRVDQLSLGTGDANWLSYSVSDGAEVKMYSLQISKGPIEPLDS
ncbi:hypothetical protein CEUSTIGMA_g1555.t1 [Chlamydomonas eustigma]|uniref:Nephrocystin 3-like N-terminal domain-containing protein n=1 Tax=Chlamydomonas eustigma TaxID=1157962 RepID=A0A250WTN0_9CHLO|nr:hypothetical protein CEUSTIGMA_g1555.t1 [Chlamydomonas eustigma]|eukprot:GAX74106.1 hypothetical protein CEUSTIGMA_g1555.t1 [Chlamydomonas eustigma]